MLRSLRRNSSPRRFRLMMAGSGPTKSSRELSRVRSTGQLPFSNSPAAPIGQAMASFLYGIVGGSITVPSTTDFAESDKYFAGFVQDDWRVNKNLTLNLGVRFDHDSFVECPLLFCGDDQLEICFLSGCYRQWK